MSTKLDKATSGEGRIGVVLEIQPPETSIDGQVTLRATPHNGNVDEFTYEFSILTDPPGGKMMPTSVTGNVATWVAKVATPRSCLAKVEIRRIKPTKKDGQDTATAEDWITVTQELPTSDDINSLRKLPPVLQGPTIPVSFSRASSQRTTDEVFWKIIRDRTDAVSFPRYKRFIDNVMCTGNLPPTGDAEIQTNYERRFESRMPFPGVASYNLLKVATEYFLMQECGLIRENPIELDDDQLGRFATREDLLDYRTNYLKQLSNETQSVIPYFEVIRERLSELDLKPATAMGPDCYGILRSTISGPCMIELIWSYWHEEGMQVQAMNAISYRFQNKRVVSGGRDPLAHLDLDPLRGASNFLWGHVQDEQHRLSVVRRAYEYDHEYGLRLYGKAVQNFESVDSRSKFLEAFHYLLYRTALFYKEDDDTTIIADGFDVLNALREVHLLLAHGAHNQFGDLPSTARQEMLIEQWLLARPELREFLGGKIMVPYDEPWMDRVDTIKSLFNWTDTSITFFHDLAEFGEQLLLSIRYGNWSQVDEVDSAINWARFWRTQIRRYIHAYRAVTGVDLSLDPVEARDADEKYLQPSALLRNRLAQQRNGGALPSGDRRALGPGSALGQMGAARSLRERNR
jgi:hypothetical protein